MSFSSRSAIRTASSIRRWSSATRTFRRRIAPPLATSNLPPPAPLKPDIQGAPFARVALPPKDQEQQPASRTKGGVFASRAGLRVAGGCVPPALSFRRNSVGVESRMRGQGMPVHEADCIRPRRDAELAVDAREVELHRLLGEPQLLRD